jgi:hypothetical protein
MLVSAIQAITNLAGLLFEGGSQQLGGRTLMTAQYFAFVIAQSPPRAELQNNSSLVCRLSHDFRKLRA